MTVLGIIQKLFGIEVGSKNEQMARERGWRHWYDLYQEMLEIEVESNREIQALRAATERYFDLLKSRVNQEELEYATEILQRVALYEDNDNWVFCNQPRCYKRNGHKGNCEGKRFGEAVNAAL